MAIAGFWRRAGNDSPETFCRAILASGSSAQDGALVRVGVDVALGRALRAILPEDRYDLGPAEFQSAGLLVFDGRIDNRDEIAAALNLSAARVRTTSDAALAALACQRWGLDCSARLLGDFILAAWEQERRRLTLLRSPLSTRSLSLGTCRSGFFFGSSRLALLQAGKIERRLDEEALLSILAGGTYVGTADSLFRGIRSLPQGHALVVEQAGERLIPIWDPPAEPGCWRSLDECGEALGAELERAVAAQLRRSYGHVAAHLSGGRDSGAVAATAALLLSESGEELLACTGAPAQGFAARVSASLLVDETALAGRTASLHPNIRHIICRSEPLAPATAQQLQQAHEAPLLTPSNLPWWDAVNRHAAGEGATVLLTGQVGNFSVSVGGPSAVRDLALEGDWSAFFSAARRFGTQFGWRNAATRIAGPLLPRALYAGLRLLNRGDSSEQSLPLLREPWRRQAERLRHHRTADRRPPASYRAFLRESLLQIDNADPASAAIYGLDVRDPTADRRLVEAMLSFPAAAWFGDEDRPAFTRAFSDRLPPEIIHARSRAYQQADWFEQFDPSDLLQSFRTHARHPLVDELFDLAAVEALVGAWPHGTAWMSDPRRYAQVEDLYRNQLLPALAVAGFIALNFPV